MERGNFIEIKKAVEELNNVFEQHKTIITDSVSALNSLGNAYKQALPSTYLQQLQQVSNLTKQQADIEARLIRIEKEREALKQSQMRTQIAQNNLDKSNITLRKAQETESERQARASKKEVAEAERLNNAYNRISILMRQAVAEYNNLAARKNFGIALTDKESQRYSQLQARIERFNNVLKKSDADIGRFQRNVGNYGTQWDGLRFQTNQLIRELPSLAYGVNVFFGAIGNNLPMFIDEVKKARAEQALALKEGKQAPGVISRITGALFNWQTAIVLGLTYLTLHGKEVANWIASLFGAEKQLNATTQALIDLNNAQTQSAVDTQNELAIYERYRDIAANTNLSYKQRKAAVDFLRSSYKGLIGDYTDEQIMNLKNLKVNNDIIEAFKFRNLYNNQNKETENIQKRLKLYEDELKIQLEYNKNLEEQGKIVAQGTSLQSSGTGGVSIEVLNKEAVAAKKRIKDLKDYEKLRKESINDEELKTASISQIRGQIASLSDTYRLSIEQVNYLKEKSIILEYEEEKTQKEKVKSIRLEVDYLASVYELRKLNAEILADENKLLMENPEVNLDKRTEALENYYFTQEHLAQMAYEEELRLNEKKYNEDIRSYQERLGRNSKELADGKITADTFYAVNKTLNENLTHLHYQYVIDKEIIDTNYENKKKKLTIDKAKELYGVLQKIYDQEARNIISEESLQSLEQTNLLMQNVDASTSLKEFAKLDNELRKLDDAETERKKELLSIDLFRNREEQDRIQNLINSGEVGLNESLVKLKEDELNLMKQAQDIDNKRLETVIKLREQLKQATQQYLTGFQTDLVSQMGLGSVSKMLDKVTYQFINSAGEIETKVGSTFDKLFDQAQTNAEKFAVAFTSSLDVFRDMYNMINQLSEGYYQREFERLEAQKEVSLKFAGESTTAREEIERQYEERRIEIERRRAKQQKEMAIFNAIINTAQAVTAALANYDYTSAILFGILGAAQVAMISAQPLPAFEHGGIHDGGSMLVNDAKGSNYRETVVTPDGKIIQPKKRNVIMNAPKGTQIFTPEQWNKQLASILNDRGIYYHNANQSSNSITKEDLAELLNQKNDNNSVEINIDKQGFQTMINRNGQRIKQLNSRVKIKR